MTSREDLLCECCKEVECEGKMCDTCRLLAPHIAGQHTGVIQDEDIISSFRQELQDPTSNIQQIWRRLRAFGSTNNPEPFPCMNEKSEWTFGEPPKWELSDEEMEAILHWRTHRIEDNVSRRLARGGILPDGTHVSFAGGTFFVEGHPCRVPYRGLNKILSRHPRISGRTQWKQLLRSIDLAATQMRMQPREGGPDSPILHPASQVVAFNVVDEFMMMEMLRRRSPGLRPRYPMKSTFRGTEWLSRWDSIGNKTTRRMGAEDLKVPVAIVERSGKLFLRVRRDTGWKRIELESDPRTWETVVTWVLSPIDHEDNKRLRTLQQHIFAETRMNSVRESDINGMRFLREVIENNERASLDLESDRIVVQGTSGLRYAIQPGKGGHNTRFVVRGLGNRDTSQAHLGNGWARMRQRMAFHNDSICIVETPQLRRLVLGDALGSITLSLLDDMVSQRHINTLRQHIRRNRPRDPIHPEVQMHNRAMELRQLLRANTVEQERRRVTESFPRLFSVLLRLPLGSRLTFTAMNRDDMPNVTFDDCETTFSTRNITDRLVFYRMLGAAGWARDRDEENVRGVTRIYIRLGTGERELGGAVEEISEMLEPRLMANGRVRVIVDPIWVYWERMNPGIGHLLPGTDEHIP